MDTNKQTIDGTQGDKMKTRRVEYVPFGRLSETTNESEATMETHKTTCKRHAGTFKSCNPNCVKTKWTAKAKSYMGNRNGFRVYRDGVLYAKHVNALRPEEAIQIAKNNMYSKELEQTIEAYNALPANERVQFLKMVQRSEELTIEAKA